MYSSELFEIELIICLKMDLALNNNKWYAIKPKQPTNQPTPVAKWERRNHKILWFFIYIYIGLADPPPSACTFASSREQSPLSDLVLWVLDEAYYGTMVQWKRIWTLWTLLFFNYWIYFSFIYSFIDNPVAFAYNITQISIQWRHLFVAIQSFHSSKGCERFLFQAF